MTPQRLEEIRARCEKAYSGVCIADISRPGNGAAVSHREAVIAQSYPNLRICDKPRFDTFSDANTVANMEFIAAAFTDIPDLLAHITELEAEVTDLKARLAGVHRPTHGPCCTCQACGNHYDDCRCNIDELADENETLKAEVTRLTNALSERTGGGSFAS